MISLEEAETAAYLDPSQENLAVYVKLLEEEIEDLENFKDFEDLENGEAE